MKIVALAGGVGGAKLVDGLAQVLPPENLTIVVNTADDFDHLGLHISPDLDTICYTLAGIANPVTGWGQINETWHALDSLALLGGPTWFRLGDRDLATHLERTRLLRLDKSLSEITQQFCRAWGIAPLILPMSDDLVQTHVLTEDGVFPFQEYFVKQKCTPRVKGFRFMGAEDARPAPGVVESIKQANVLIICPSNPWVSIDPILSIPGIRQEVRAVIARQGKVLAVSPIVAGQAIKGPAAKMYLELGIEPSAKAVADHYGSWSMVGILTDFVIDLLDSQLVSAIESMGIKTYVTNTIMKTSEDRLELAGKVLEFAKSSERSKSMQR